MDWKTALLKTTWGGLKYCGLEHLHLTSFNESMKFDPLIGREAHVVL